MTVPHLDTEEAKRVLRLMARIEAGSREHQKHESNIEFYADVLCDFVNRYGTYNQEILSRPGRGSSSSRVGDVYWFDGVDSVDGNTLYYLAYLADREDRGYRYDFDNIVERIKYRVAYRLMHNLDLDESLDIEIIRGGTTAIPYIRHAEKIYNEANHLPDPARMEIKDKRSVVIIRIPGVCVAVGDRIRHPEHPDKTRHLIMCHYLCVEKEHRGKGIATKLINFAKENAISNGTRLIGAYVETDEQRELWKALGFPYQGNIGLNQTMFDRPTEHLWDKEWHPSDDAEKR
ncbi:GNAT family N-acetyltransferase [Vibrio maritimus]